MGNFAAMAKRSKQLQFRNLAVSRDSFGGSLLKGNPKVRRPLDSKLPTHLVLRANASFLRLPKRFAKVNEAVALTCRKHGVSIYRYANVGNHIHLLVRLRSRRGWAAFIRELTGRVAQIALGLGPSEKSAAKFWKFRPFTRVVRGWKKAYQLALRYVELNRLEAEGLIRRTESKTLRELRAVWDG